MAIDGQAFELRYVLYFDFLGTGQATKSCEVAKLYEFVDLLRGLVHLRGAQDISGTPMSDGGYKISLKPEISTFSDHIVATYPAGRSDDERVSDILQPLWVEFICKDCIRVMSTVAERGIRLGLLMRGGLSFRELFHGDDVVFGEALVDAHRLESEVAIFPRIIVSDRLLDQFRDGPAAHPDILLQDSDRLWHLNYFPELQFHGIGAGGPESILHWYSAIRRIIEQNRVLVADQPSVRSKWEWFDARIWATMNVKRQG